MTNALLATVTLPSAPSISVGNLDEIGVMASGAGEVKLAAGTFNFAPGTVGVWAIKRGAVNTGLTAATSDSSGTKLFAAANIGDLWSSSNGGTNWTNIGTAVSLPTANKAWQAVASDATGTNLVAVVRAGDVWTSSDSGYTWVDRNNFNATWTGGFPGSVRWTSVASDATGQKLVAAISQGSLWLSSNAGRTWTNSGLSHNWTSVSSDTTGQYLAAVASGGDIFTSINSGATWTDQSAARATATHNLTWQSVASDSAGQQLVAVTQGDGIWTSPDRGVTWNNKGYARSGWMSVASDGAGANLYAVDYAGDIWGSIDQGDTWFDQTPTGGASGLHWQSIASNAAGTKVIAVANNSFPWILSRELSTCSGFLVGAPGATITLVCTDPSGAGAYEILSVTGQWWCEA